MLADTSSVDKSCTTNADCVSKDACVCNCVCPVLVAFNRNDESSFQDARAAVDCVDHDVVGDVCEYCIEGCADICVNGECQFHDGFIPEQTDPPPGPDEWDRTCEVAGPPCVIVRVNQCVLCDCGGTLTAIADEAREDAVRWSSHCDKSDDNCSSCSEGQSELRAEAYCDEGLCSWAEGPLQPAEGIDCFSFGADARACVEAGCFLNRVNLASVENDVCHVEQQYFCMPHGGIDYPPGYDFWPARHRDGIAANVPESAPGWVACDETLEVCKCLD